MIANIVVFPKSIHLRQSNANYRLLWSSILAGPLAYTSYFSVSYLLLQITCRMLVLQAKVGGLSICSILFLALTLLAALITLLTGLSNLRRLRLQFLISGDDPTVWMLLMMWGGMLLSVFFTGLILMTGFPLFVLQSYTWM